MLDRLIIAGLLGAVLTAAALAPAAAGGRHDGIWSVQTSAETGKCATNYDLKVNVKDGRVAYAGMWPVKATGGIDNAGLIRMDISHAGRKVHATGLVRGDEASGDWESSGPACSGSWYAKKA